MRKVTFGVASSLDNFIARTDGAVDWLMWSDEAAEVTKDFWQKIDTVLLGRKTYEVGLKYSKGKNPYPNIKTYVFSRTLEAAEGGAEIVSENAAQFVRELKQKDGKEIRHDTEPDASLWRRAVVEFLSLLPIDWML